jgi:HK97 family phage portal protein
VTPGQPIYPKPGYVNNVKFGYAKNEIIYSCMTFKSDSFARVEMDVVNAQGDVLQNHPLDLLMSMPNPHTTEFEMMQKIMTDLDLYGLAYLEKVRSRSGQVVQLWRLRPDYVRPVPSTTEFIQYYEFDNNTGRKVQLPFEDVIEFKLYDPLNEYRGLAPVTVAARIGDVDTGGVDYLKNFFDHGGMPAGFITTAQPVSDTIAAQIGTDWESRYGGKDKWTKPAVLSYGAEYKQLGSSLKDLQTDKLDAKTVSRICMTLDVNPILIGAAHGLARSTFNNYQTALKSFWQEGLQPQMKRIIETFNTQLAIEFGVKLQWDLSNIPALQEDKDQVWKRAGAALTGGGITVDEYRALIGLEKVKGGDIFLRRQVIEVGTDGEEEEKSHGKVCRCGKTHTIAEESELTEKLKKSLEVKVSTPDDEDDRLKREKITAVDTLKFFKGQERRIFNNIERKGLAPFNAEVYRVLGDLKNKHSDQESEAFKKERIEIIHNALYKLLDADFWEAENKAFDEVMLPLLLGSGQISVANTIAAFEETYQIGIPIDLSNQATAKWARKYSAQLVKGINKTTRNSVAESVAAWVETDLPRSALVDELAPLFGKTRSKTIGRTETTKAFFEGNRQTWKQSGIVKGFTWRTTESACPICGPLEGVVFPLNAAGPPDASHPNCNCFTEAVIDQEAIDATTQ